MRKWEKRERDTCIFHSQAFSFFFRHHPPPFPEALNKVEKEKDAGSNSSKAWAACKHIFSSFFFKRSSRCLEWVPGFFCFFSTPFSDGKNVDKGEYKIEQEMCVLLSWSLAQEEPGLYGPSITHADQKTNVLEKERKSCKHNATKRQRLFSRR